MTRVKGNSDVAIWKPASALSLLRPLLPLPFNAATVSASSSVLRLSHDGDGEARDRCRHRHQESRDPPGPAGDYPLQGPG